MIIALILFVIQGGTSPVEAKVMNILPKTNPETLEASPLEMVLPKATIQDRLSCSSTSGTFSAPPSSPPFPSSIPDLEEFNSHSALRLSPRLQNLVPQTRETETGEMNRSSLDSSCLLTPPNTPHIIDPRDLVKPDQEKWENGDSVALPWSSAVDIPDEGKTTINTSIFMVFHEYRESCKIVESRVMDT